MLHKKRNVKFTVAYNKGMAALSTQIFLHYFLDLHEMNGGDVYMNVFLCVTYNSSFISAINEVEGQWVMGSYKECILKVQGVQLVNGVLQGYVLLTNKDTGCTNQSIHVNTSASCSCTFCIAQHWFCDAVNM
jgi:hypothetical protein